MLRIDPGAALPIWRQIEEGVSHLVASGALAPGGVLPSVRDLARELRVNPATVAKAYQRLVDAGVLEVRRGDGTYVAETPPLLAKGERTRVLGEAAVRYAVVARNLGTARSEALAEVRAAYDGLERGGGGKG